MLANAKSLIFTRRLRLFFCGELCDWESCVDLRIDGFRDIAWEVGLEERDRFEVVEGAAEARREIAGEGGAGRVEVSDVESEQGLESRVDVLEWFEYEVCVEDKRLTIVAESPGGCEAVGSGDNGFEVMAAVGVMGEFNAEVDEPSGIEG